MKKTRKVQLLAGMLGVMATVMGFAFINNPVQAKAAEETATPTFAMTTGASVRAVQNQAGIRWKTTVNKAWYDAFVETLTEQGKVIADYSFGTWVTSATNVTDEEGKVGVTKLDGTFSGVNDAAKVKNLVCPEVDEPNFAETETTEAETTFTYYSSILYNNMSDWEDEA